jgi:hypothetical protein
VSGACESARSADTRLKVEGTMSTLKEKYNTEIRAKLAEELQLSNPNRIAMCLWRSGKALFNDIKVAPKKSLGSSPGFFYCPILVFCHYLLGKQK